MKAQDLSELYTWIRENNQHTSDEVVDFMYQAAKEKYHELNPYGICSITSLSGKHCPNASNHVVEHQGKLMELCDLCHASYLQGAYQTKEGSRTPISDKMVVDTKFFSK